MHNLASGIFTQSLREMGLLVTALGGSMESVSGLPGVGDLYVTCLAGRNSRMGRLLGLGHSYTVAKRDFMAEDTVEGADLARAIGPALRRLWAHNGLPTDRMPLARAVVDAVCDDVPLRIDWQKFAR
jgi:glycerol-3-phosphate dehydrogenase (NAD(P)+)